MRRLTVTAACLLAAAAHAQTRNETSVLAPDGAPGAFDDWFGDSVAIDGGTALVGAPRTAPRASTRAPQRSSTRSPAPASHASPPPTRPTANASAPA